MTFLLPGMLWPNSARWDKTASLFFIYPSYLPKEPDHEFNQKPIAVCRPEKSGF